jgi:hypothetical protein
MTYQPERTRTRRIPRILVAGLVFAAAAIPAADGFGVPAFSSSSSAQPSASARPTSSSSPGASLTAVLPTQRHALGEADGAIPDDTTVFDDSVPGVARLDPALLAALRRATTAAAEDGVELYVNSGWRSPAYEEQLLREATSKYGSEREAARWVATPDTSAHVSGDAVDIGPVEATAWLSPHGSRYGLCQIYRNERWHYELRPKAIEHGCPSMYADAAHDPRMQH